jgi:hypothetical protein
MLDPHPLPSSAPSTVIPAGNGPVVESRILVAASERSMGVAPSEPPPEPPARPVAPSSGMVQVALVCLAGAICLAGFIAFAILTYHVQKPGLCVLMAIVAVFGAAGGLLFALRDGELQPVVVSDAGLRLGWMGDALYGIAGAYAVFLLLPGFSESATNEFEVLLRNGVADTNSTDVLEVIAVSLIGGLGGRSVMRRASETILQEKLQQVEKRIETQQARVQQEVQRTHQELALTRQQIGQSEREAEAGLRQELDDVRQALRDELELTRKELAAARADSDVLAEVAKYLNPAVPDPEKARLRKMLGEASEAGRHRVFDYVLNRLHVDGKRVAGKVVPILEALRESDPDGFGNLARGALAEALLCNGQAVDADALVDEALREVRPNGPDRTRAVTHLRELKTRIQAALKPPKPRADRAAPPAGES